MCQGKITCININKHTQTRGCTHLLLRFYNNGPLIFLRHQHTGGKGGFDHVDDQVIGQDVQFLHLIPSYIGASSNAITSNTKQREERDKLN